ncbi:MAG: hypothetical protein LC620_01480 [Halobacteriales archaeon]|nr:hypothetical protein [Halobacteriales archaeon]
MYADKGQAGAHKEVVTLSTPSGAKSFTFTTSDGSHFTSGGGFERVSDAVSVHDGTRFYVDGWAKLSALGKVGDRVSGFKVEAYTGSSVGDFMPGGCNNTIGTCQDPTGSMAADSYAKPDYALRGPTYYASLDVPAQTVQVGSGAESMEELTIVNSLADESQKITVTVEGADGVTARFHNPNDVSGGGYSDVASVELAARQQTIVHLALTGTTAGKHGTLTLTLTTSLGGRLVKQVQYQVVSGGGCMDGSMSGMTSMEGMATCPSTTTTKGKPSPPPGLAAIALALALVIVARRS